MENIFGVLLAIGFVIISFVQNYKKEAEKAAKRVPHKRPPVPSTPVDIPPATSRPKQKVREVLEKKVEKPKLEYKPNLPNEVIIAQKRRKERQLANKIEVTSMNEDGVNNAPFVFNLREAVIQSAILERPYK